MKPTLTVSSDFTQQFNQLIKRFRNDSVLVGIPEEKSERMDNGDGEQINNATLLAIANFGSPQRNIPPWPIMSIGIRNAKDDLAEEYRKAAITSLKTGFDALDTYYNRAGIIASNSIKKVINQQEQIPDNKPAEATLEARKNRKPTPFKGTKYWLVTGQMRNSITYVIGGRR